MKHTVKKSDAISLCKSIAECYGDWEFTAGKFKNEQLIHTVKILDLSPIFTAGSMTIGTNTMILNKKIIALEKKIMTHKKKVSEFTSFIRHADFEKDYDFSLERFYTLNDGKAEKVIRHALDVSIKIFNKYYSYSDENELLSNLPEMFDGPLAVKYCIVRAYLGDFDYVRDYKLEKIKSIRPKRHDDIDKIIEYFNIEI
jgi:hypothetical protein